MQTRYNQTIVDVWTPVHASTGFVAGVGGVSPVMYFSLAVAFEIFEQTLEAKGEKGAETAVNVLGDLASGLVLYAWGRHLRAGMPEAPPVSSSVGRGPLFVGR